MIVPMKHVALLCVAAERDEALARLRDFGGMHVTLKTAESAGFRDAQSAREAALQALRHIEDAAKGVPVTPVTGGHHTVHGIRKLLADIKKSALPERLDGHAADVVKTVNELAETRQTLVNEAARLDTEVDLYRHFGEFDVALPPQLAAQGIPVRLFRCPSGQPVPASSATRSVHMLGADRAAAYGVMIGDGEWPESCEAIELPETPLSDLTACRDTLAGRADAIGALLASAAPGLAEIRQETERLSQALEFAAVAEAMEAREHVAWITGWAPAEQEKALREHAAKQMWGLLLRDPGPEDTPPTLLRPPRLFRPVLALFEALGIAPAYNEADVSVPFFCFFSIFFAMLVGDGGYGALILALTLWARRKLTDAPRAPFVLLTFFACATMVWGFLSNTWFGTHPGILSNPVSVWLGDPQKGLNNTMLVCFTLGVAHLSSARFWNAVNLFPDTKFLAQAGWIGVLVFMYCMTCQIIGIFPAPRAVYPVFGVSLILIFLFTLKKSELRGHGIELGMMPLTIFGCLGDIISYVRLFAVGLASVKVAENFNQMALNLDLPLWAKIVPVILILLIGHGLNFLMAGLSILVHAVRLNTLEFSNHKGVTWSGYAFKPFRRT
ncbi:MAG: hypothetical protein PHG96_10665 [Kiritimatiellae bacterium]|nr:hypothetical protein [Kiritimatiellia bacterium]